jgi:hypothetical protein
MPQYEVTYTRRSGKRSITSTARVQAVGETHAESLALRILKGIFKTFIRIIFIKQV